MCWYVAQRYTDDLRALRTYRPTAKPAAQERPHERVLAGLLALARFLISETDTMGSSTDDKQRQAIYRRIPGDIPDPAALAHELLWRVEKEIPGLGEAGITEEKGRGAKRANGGKEEKGMRLLDRPTPSRTWRFQPS